MSISFLIPHHSYETERVKEELLNLQVKNIEIYTWNSIKYPLAKFPAVLWVRFSPKIPIIYQLASIEEFEENGTCVVNSKDAIEKCDKMSSYLFWKRNLQNDFRMPKTIITRNIKHAVKFIQEYDCVFKPIDLGLGQGIQRLQNDSKLKITLQLLLNNYGLLFLQEFISNPGYDIRAIVIDQENVIEYARENPEDFRYNVNLGGKIKALNTLKNIKSTLLQNIQEIALTITRRTKLDMLGIDFLISEKQEIFVLEWNAFFNFQGVEKTLEINIAKRIALLLNKLTSS
ncbi:MAG: RimK family alpha-L-glutamate ligase [Promethearchaeota archaeon]